MSNGNIIRALAAFMLMAMVGLMIGCDESNTAAGGVNTSQSEVTEASALMSSESTQVTTTSGLTFTIVESRAYCGAELPQSSIAEGTDNRTSLGDPRRPFEDRTGKGFEPGVWINTALADEGVQSEMAGWQGQGRVLNRSKSLVIHGRAVRNGTTDTVDVVTVHLDMEAAVQPDPFIVEIEFAYSPQASHVVQSSIRTLQNPGDATFQRIFLGNEDGTDHYVWVKDFPPYGYPDSSGSPYAFDWYSYKVCCLCAMIGGCIASAAICVATVVAWPACTLVGCAMVSPLAACIGCALEQLF